VIFRFLRAFDVASFATKKPRRFLALWTFFCIQKRRPFAPNIYSKIFEKKVIVTKKSTKKSDCEHYGLSDEIDVFFKSKTFFCKMDIYFCPFLKNPKNF
jgi:hypothetical protein